MGRAFGVLDFVFRERGIDREQWDGRRDARRDAGCARGEDVEECLIPTLGEGGVCG